MENCEAAAPKAARCVNRKKGIRDYTAVGDGEVVLPHQCRVGWRRLHVGDERGWLVNASRYW